MSSAGGGGGAPRSEGGRRQASENTNQAIVNLHESRLRHFSHALAHTLRAQTETVDVTVLSAASGQRNEADYRRAWSKMDELLTPKLVQQIQTNEKENREELLLLVRNVNFLMDAYSSSLLPLATVKHNEPSTLIERRRKVIESPGDPRGSFYQSAFFPFEFLNEKRVHVRENVVEKAGIMRVKCGPVVQHYELVQCIKENTCLGGDFGVWIGYMCIQRPDGDWERVPGGLVIIKGYKKSQLLDRRRVQEDGMKEMLISYIVAHAEDSRTRYVPECFGIMADTDYFYKSESWSGHTLLNVVLKTRCVIVFCMS